MKKIYASVLTALTAISMAVPAFADAALPPYYSVYRYYRGAMKWVAAFAVALVIFAVVVIIAAVKYRRGERTLKDARAKAKPMEAQSPRKPEDQ